MDQREKGEREKSYLNGMTQQAALVTGVTVGHPSPVTGWMEALLEQTKQRRQGR
jgi:hypothetical protein